MVKKAVKAQIAQEKKQLAEVPKIPIVEYLGGPQERCCICGQCWPLEQLDYYDTHVPGQRDSRWACPQCHPSR